jgi:type IV pilus biogenesis protein CpaD/CtpE
MKGRYRRNVKEFTRWLCWELLDACGNEASPAGNHPLKSYPPFKPLAIGHEKQNMDKVLGEMEDAGLRGKVWTREELEQFVGRQASSSSEL